MSAFAIHAAVDWSGGGDRGARPKRDAIWTAAAGASHPAAPRYHRNRAEVVAYLDGLITEAGPDQRVLVGFDFPFGYPAGFAVAVTGRADPFAIWARLADVLGDDPADRLRLAASLNARWPGEGPFWFNPLRAEVAGLPRTKPAAGALPEFREAERVSRRLTGKRPFSCWQMGGAGAVGSQAITGIAALERLRRAHPGRIAVWPFEPLDRDVAFVEIWPSLLSEAVASFAATADLPRDRKGVIGDAAQVALWARLLARLDAWGDLAAVLDDVPEVARREEGWILGLGHEARLGALARDGAEAGA